MKHNLKSWTAFYKYIEDGTRTSDIRSTEDRRFQVGDTLNLQEFDPVKFQYTGREQEVEITFIQTNKSNPCAISEDALNNNFAVLSIKKV